MSDHYIGMSSRQINGMIVIDNYMPIELVWENVISEFELDVIGKPMPVVRKNYKDAQLAFITHLTEIDQMNRIEKSREKWQEKFLIRKNEKGKENGRIDS